MTAMSDDELDALAALLGALTALRIADALDTHERNQRPPQQWWER